MKSEPDVFSIEDLERVKVEPWDGIRNYQARNFMRDQMRVGDRVLFYHSNCQPPGVAGLARIASEPYPDPTAFDEKSHYFDPKSKREAPTWILVEVAFEERFECIVSMEELRAEDSLRDMVILRKGNRLSICPVTGAEYDKVVELGRR
ncbi:MAG: EVE domain-containing protein [Puniceicoccaceae bacterium]